MSLSEALINDPSQWTVLIVDDDPDNLEIASDTLKGFKAKVYTSQNGAECLQFLAENPAPTFILLDLSMPVMDGWQALAHIRADESLRDLNVIALTAHAMLGDAERGLEAGFNGYITKPFQFDSFISDIQKILRT
jgi:CheY-like chemotaxis protein